MNINGDKQAECRHNWLIEPPEGPVSSGICRICGLTREFKNYIESDPRDNMFRSKEQTDNLKVSVPSDDVITQEIEEE